jgi:acetyl-CoA carboxylase carboxyl transferase subunit alpha
MDINNKIANTKSAYAIVQLARHAQRPNIDFIVKNFISNFVEIHGDRRFQDDPAVLAGMGTLFSQDIVILGTRKGSNTKENIHRNFGMAKPEGYRKGCRAIEFANRFNLPILAFIDTPGAYPGVDAEYRGQSEAIANTLLTMMNASVPCISVIVGEGGSGGALAFGVSNKVFMLENSIYSVITPEGCASILWRDATKAPEAAEAMGVGAAKALNLGIIDGILPEYGAGAHETPWETYKQVCETLFVEIMALKQVAPQTLQQQRWSKFMNLGKFYDLEPVTSLDNFLKNQTITNGQYLKALESWENIQRLYDPYMD